MIPDEGVKKENKNNNEAERETRTIIVGYGKGN